MKRNGRWQLVAALAAAVGIGGLHPSAVAAQGATSAAFTILLRNYAKVPPDTLAEAERAATVVFQRAGIEARWNEIDVNPIHIGPARLQDQPATLADVQVNLLPETAPIPAGLSEKAVAVTPGAGPGRTVVDVFDARVRSLSRRISSAYLKSDTDRSVSRGQLLGHVIAHEVGHVLLNQPGHSPRGIMRGEWTFADFRDMGECLLIFTPQQALILRAEVARRSAGERMDVATTGSPSTIR